MSDATTELPAGDPVSIAELQKQIEELKKVAAKPDYHMDAQSVLSIGLPAAFIGLIVLVIFHPPDKDTASAIWSLIGAFGILAGLPPNYIFGSSKTSQTKDNARDALTTTLVNKVVANGAEPTK